MPKANTKLRTHAKDENLFKYTSFSDHINSISVANIQRAVRVVADPNIDDDDNQSFLATGLQLQLIESQTQTFQKTVKLLQPFIGSYREIVYHQNEIFAHLESNLEDCDDSSLVGLMRLTTDFCKDIQTDFYQFFYRLVTILGGKMNTLRSLSALQAVFNCITVCIKITLSCFSSSDVANLLSGLQLFMESKKKLQIKFASGAFAFVAKKLVESDDLIRILYFNVTQKAIEAYQLIITEIAKGVGVDFSFRFPGLLKSLIANHPVNSDVEELSVPTKLLTSTVEGLLSMITRDPNKREESVNFCWKTIADILTSTDELQIIYLVLKEVLNFQNGRLVMKYLMNRVLDFLVNLEVRFEHELHLWKDLCSIVLTFPVESQSTQVKAFKKTFFGFEPNTFPAIASLICEILKAESNSFLKSCCLFEVTNLVLESVKYFGSEINDSESNRSMALAVVVYTISRTNYSTEKEIVAQMYRFLDHFSKLNDLSCIEKAGLVFVASCLPAKFEWAKKSLKSIERNLEIAKCSIDMDTSESFEMYLWKKATFRYKLEHSKMTPDENQLLLSRIEKSPKDLDNLSALAVYISSNSQENNIDLKRLAEILKPNFRSFRFEVVRKTVQVFASVQCLPSKQKASNQKNESSAVLGFFERLQRIANIENSVQLLRERLMLCEKLKLEDIQKLKLDTSLAKFLEPSDFVEIGFAFLLSLCFIRFVPLQKGLEDILSSYGNHKVVKKVLSDILNEAFNSDKRNENAKIWFENRVGSSGDSNLLEKSLLEFNPENEIIRTVKKREIVLEMFKMYPSLSGIVAKEIKTQFFMFLARDFFCSNSRRLQKIEEILEITLSKSEEKVKLEEKESHVPTLLSFFKVLSALSSNPLIRKDEKLFKLLKEMLKSNLSFLQNATLDFLLELGLPYLNPYKDYLSQLCSDKTVKKGLTDLKLSSENGIVNEVHRREFLEIIMLYLLGRVFNAGWVSNVDERFRYIFQFVHYLNSEEKEHFLTETFSSFTDLLSAGQVSNFDHSKFEIADLSRFLLIFQQVLRNMQRLSFLPIMKVFGKCNLNICLSLERSKKSWSNSLSGSTRNKKLFKQGMVCLLSYLDVATEPFDDSEVKSICEVLLKPALMFNSAEDISKATLSIQAKFVQSFAANSYYRKYLNYQIDSRNSKSLLACLCQFLQPNAPSQLQFFVLGVLVLLIPEETEDNDVNDDDEEVDSSGDEMEVGSSQPTSSSEDENILKSHSCFVIKFLQNKMLSDKFKSLSAVQRMQLLKVLLFLVSDITSPQQSLALATTLAAYMSKKRKILPIDMSSDITKLIVTLLKNCESPYAVLFTLAANFSENLPMSIRDDLCNIYSIISSEFAELLRGLNSWNPKFVDEPDYAVRFENFSKIPALLEDMRPQDCVIAIAVIFKNCCYFIETIEDFAVRDRCVETVNYLIRKFDFNAKIISMVKFQISNMLKSKPEDAVLINIMNIFKCFIEHCHEKDSILDELRVLQTGKVDFIDDIAQLQVSRRCRGLIKISQFILEDKFCMSTCTFFLIPIAWISISKFELVKDPNLITASIELLKSCATKMELSTLVRLAERCLLMVNRNNENPKVACRVLSAILTAFGSNDMLAQYMTNSTKIEKANVVLNTFAGRTLAMLMNQKMTDSEIIDKDESNAIIAKLPVHIGLYNVAKHLPAKRKDFTIKKLILSLCGFLRSRDKSVRHATRGVLLQILPNLDFEYLNQLIKDLFQLLDRGYLRHILVFTLYRVLTEAKACFKAGDFTIGNLTEIGKFLIRDLFGLGAEERTSAKLISKTEEARKSYAVPCYGLIGYFCSNDNLIELLKPLSEGLEEKETNSNKRIVTDILNKFGAEILLNKKLKTLEILTFVEQVCNGNLLKMFEKTAKDTSSEKRDVRLQPKDYRLLDPVPTRAVDRRPNVITFSYHHVFVQFGFQLLLKLTSKVDANTLKKEEVRQILQNMSPLVVKSLNSSYLPVLIQAIRCLKEFLAVNLEGLMTSENFDRLILINKRFCRGTSISSETQELVPVVLSCMKVFLSNENLTVRKEQLAVILAHIEEDLNDKNKVKASLSLLKAIISRRLKHESVTEVVSKVSKLMIQSPMSSNRINCRNLYLDYLIGYANEKTEKSLDFVLAQVVNYEEATGRESAIELLVLFVTKANESFLNSMCEKLFFPLCLAVGKDSSQNCRKFARLCLGKLLSRVGEEEYIDFTETSLKWMKKYMDVSLVMVGFMVMDILVENFRSSLDDKLSDILEISNKALDECDVKHDSLLPNSANSVPKSESNESRTRTVDYTILTVFKLIHRVLAIIDLTSAETVTKYQKSLAQIAQKLKEYVSYPHEWVQVQVCQIFALVFSKFQAVEFCSSFFAHSCLPSSNETAEENNLNDFLKKIISDVISNVTYIEASKELMDISLKNIVYLTLVFASEFLSEKSLGTVLLPFVIDEMGKLAMKEMRFNNKCFTKRQFVFSWNQFILQSHQFVETCQKLSAESLHKLLQPVVRELVSKSNESNTEFAESFQNTYQSFEKSFKSLVNVNGDGSFLSWHYSKIVASLRERKLERNVTRKREAVLNPELHAAKKIQDTIKRRVNRKRKMAEKKGQVPSKKGKLGSKVKNSDEILVEDLL
ncbi:small subunit processome component 20 homolog [Convolutriloba macropyga]|uniref:small subunit processome component 20 homolog n=1 Tax=Convolutriloba macropyga TaxID=536237 RepID=UPI003F51B576